MSIDRYSIDYVLTDKGWVELVNFKGDPDDVIEEWSANCRQASAFSEVEVSWQLTRRAAPDKEDLAKSLHAKHKKPADFF
ncbi:hypothetical protein [Pseudomonas fluorescens]|uniref:Uncharacterized protein n=1 Tax=Pseudomonas fluorescens TaxID=294 RepID=A0A7Z3C1V1_PSEFL|nr:hypothetical protein [Pseudomonas fluorescens]QJP93750.1 hypothetical protein C6Y56_03810 [Pseudomonas fluorescens]